MSSIFKELNNIRNNNIESVSSISNLFPVPSSITFPELNFPHQLIQSILQNLLNFLQNNMTSNAHWPSTISTKKSKKKDDQLTLIDFILFLGILSIQIAPSIEFDDDKFANFLKLIDKHQSFQNFINSN